MPADEWIERTAAMLRQRRDNALLRRRLITHPIDAIHLEIDGKPYVNFCSNNYLGLTHHPRVVGAMKNAAAGAGSGSAGLIAGHTQLHARVESRIAEWKRVESAILFPSGYQANIAAVQTLAQIGESYPGGVRFLLDRLCHASLIDAVRSTEKPLRVFPHNHIARLERFLAERDPEELQVVLTESIFSMDGDACDLQAIAELKQKYPFILLVDEAHGSGVYGPAGAGFVAETQLQNAVDVSIVTLSKAIGCSGGAVCSSRVFADALLNFGRAYIYSTSISPIVAAGVEAAIDVMRDEPDRQRRVRELGVRVRSELTRAGLPIPVGDSPIIPIILGGPAAALNAAEQFKDESLLVIAVRPPTVPSRSSRLRVTVSSEHSDDEIERLMKCAKKIASPRR